MQKTMSLPKRIVAVLMALVLVCAFTPMMPGVSKAYADAATPANVTDLNYNQYFSKANSSYSTYKLTVAFNSEYTTGLKGFQGELYDKSGNLVQTVNTDSTRCAVTFSKASWKKAYKVHVRGYAVDSATGQTTYGAWSSWFYAIATPQLKASKKNVKKTQYKIGWTKQTDAKKYSIYVAKTKKYKSVSKMKTKDFKKVATVSAKKNSYTVKKVGKSKVNTKKYYYYTYVVAEGKVGGKTVKSIPYNAFYCHVY